MPEELRNLTTECRAQVEATLTAALLRPAALARADELEAGPLVELQPAAAAPLAAVAAAKEARDEEKQSIHNRLAEFYNSKRRKQPDDDEHPPANETPRLLELQRALSAAEMAASGPESKVRGLGYEIEALRAAPAADPAVLGVLREALKGA